MDLLVIKHVIHFYNTLIFGHEQKLSIKPKNTSHIVNLTLSTIKQQLKDIDVASIASEGGLLRIEQNIESDLNTFNSLVKSKNEKFLNNELLIEREDVTKSFKTSTVKKFIFQLSESCKGELDSGMLSNRFIYRKLKKPTDDPPCLVFDHQKKSIIKKSQRDILNKWIANKGSTDFDEESFQDPEFWALTTKRLLMRQCDEGTSLQPEQHQLNAIEFLYWSKCKSEGEIIDPFLLRLDLWPVVDPRYWATVDTLLSFMRHQPYDPLSLTVRRLCWQTIENVLNNENIASELMIAENNQQLNLFQKNILIVDETIPKVYSKYIPSKLIDVYQRLLALTKYDHLWQENSINEKMGDDPNDWGMFNLYLYNVALQIELKHIRNKLMEEN